MATKEFVSESGHWYDRDGLPRYTIMGKNGKERNTTLRDARTESLVPSVTTVLNVAAKPALTNWLMEQVLLAALTLPRHADESEELYVKRIVNDSKAQGRDAADLGTDIHAAVQSFYEGSTYPRHDAHVKACHNKLVDYFGTQAWISERSFAHDLGFGGKCDLYTDKTDESNGIVADIKTKDFKDGDKIAAYDEHLMQLAAYRVGLGVPKARCANIFLSRTVPGAVHIHEWPEEDLARGWSMFVKLLEFWQLKNQHK